MTSEDIILEQVYSDKLAILEEIRKEGTENRHPLKKPQLGCNDWVLRWMLRRRKV